MKMCPRSCLKLRRPGKRRTERNTHREPDRARRCRRCHPGELPRIYPRQDGRQSSGPWDDRPLYPPVVSRHRTEGSNPSLSASPLIGRHLTIPTEQNPLALTSPSATQVEHNKASENCFVAAIASGDAVLTFSDNGPNPDAFQSVRAGRSHN
jgi:hypothetical protein